MTCSPFLLNGTVRLHLEKYLPLRDYTETARQLLLNLHVDDISNSFNSIEESFDFYKISENCLLGANFQLRKWATKDKTPQKLMDDMECNTEKCISSDDVSSTEETFGISNEYRKVLGINWDLANDKFIFEFNNAIDAAKKLNVTKRNILKLSAMFFDPLGSFSLLALQAKLIFKDVCLINFSWDDNLPAVLTNKWKSFINELKSVKAIEIQRHVLCCGSTETELHGFCDASTVADGAVVYARSICAHGVKVSLWAAKSCVAPSKEQTVHRLELLAAVLLPKLIVSTKSEVERVLTL